MSQILIVDDLRSLRDNVAIDFAERGIEVIVARSSREALRILQDNPNGAFEALYLDHDLGIVDGQIDTVMPVVDWLSFLAFSKKPLRVATVYVHTSNPIGGMQMVRTLQRYGYNAVRINSDEVFQVLIDEVP